MRSLVAGVIYDTSCATFVAEVYTRVYATDSYVRYYVWRLYITKKGNWFGLVRDNNWLFSFLNEHELLPLSADEAYKLLSDNELIELIKHYFPDKIQEA